MSISLLSGAGAGVISPAVDVRPVVRDCEPLNFVGVGTFDHAITIEGSPTTHGTDWITLGTLAAPNATLTVSVPWERVRAKTHASEGGLATVYLIPDA